MLDSTPPSSELRPVAETTSLAELVERDVARMVLDRSYLSNLLTVPGSCLIAWVVWPYNAWVVVGTWLAFKQVVCFARWRISHAARESDSSQLPLWGRRYALAALRREFSRPRGRH
mgnify:CR=1 FL=1